MITLVVMLTLAAPAPSSPSFPAYVMNRIDDMHRGASSHGIMTMAVQTKEWTRTMSMEAWSSGLDYSLIRILEPKKERGTATLKAKHDLYTYLSKTGQTIKITGGMMGSSWMGSHFTNDDLVKETRLADEYEIALSKEGKVSGEAMYVFTLSAKPDAAVVWSKVELTVRQSDLVPTQEFFYDEAGKANRAMQFENYKDISGHKVAMQLTMRLLDGSNEFTRITYQSLAFDVKTESAFFSVQNLKSL
jgi:outer membrane lipoprotein-sorting protein